MCGLILVNVGYIGDYMMYSCDWAKMNDFIEAYCADCTCVLPPMLLEQWHNLQDRIRCVCTALIWSSGYGMFYFSTCDNCAVPNR